MTPAPEGGSESTAGPASILSVVIPAYDECEVIEATIHEVERALEACRTGFEIIVVDDGSADGTFDRLRFIIDQNKHVKALRLSRNFGKEAAILAGLEASSGNAVITIDADLQHPPALIPEMVRAWRQGVKVVNAVKRDRHPSSRLSNRGGAIFNTLLTYLGGRNLKNASDFKLLDRIVVDAIVNKIPERTRFYRGLTDWVGYEQATILFDVEARAGGVTKWSFLSLFKLAVSALISFTAAPLRIVTFLGVATLIFGLIVGTDAVVSWSQGEAVSGFATIIVTMCVIGSFIMLSLGIMGEYIARIFQESKCRPAYLIEASLGFEDAERNVKND